MTNPDITAKVDQLLEQQGEYLPLELLLAENRLLYHDYDQWRDGTVEYLDECLFGDSDNSLQLLSEAAEYARKLGLQPEALHYKGWGGGNALTFSHNPPINSLFHIAYRKDQSIPQLDLFMDNVGNNLANDAIAALADRDMEKARAAVDRLMQSDPLHAKIDPLLTLIESASDLEVNPEGLQRLDREIVPLAHELLGRNAENLLILLWRRAADCVKENRFDPEHPEHHASSYWGQANDPDKVLASVEREADWRDQPELLIRHAAANGKLRRNKEAQLDLFRLSWVYPEMIGACIDCLEGLFQHPWERFLDSDDDLEDRDFPAWLLIQHPQQAQSLSKTEIAKLEPAPGFIILLQLVRTEQQQLAPEYRAKLKEEHPALLKCYLKRH